MSELQESEGIIAIVSRYLMVGMAQGHPEEGR